MHLTVNRKIAIQASIPIVAFLVFGAFFLWNQWEEVEISKTMRLNGQLIKIASNLISQLQKERGLSNLFITGAVGQAEVAAQREQTDVAQSSFLDSLSRAVIPGETKDAARRGLSGLGKLRTDVNSKTSMAESFKGYTGLVNVILATQTETLRAKTSGGIGKRLANVALFEEAKENAGKLRGLLSGLIAANRPLSDEEVETIVRFNSRIRASIESPALSISKEVEKQIQGFSKDPSWIEVSNVFGTVLKNGGRGDYGIDPKVFFANATKQVEDINGLGQKELEGIEKAILQFGSNAVSRIWWNFGLLLFTVFALGAVSILIGRSISRPIADVAGHLSHASQRVFASSADVASSSQQIAEGASEQAAAIEETSSSLEEIASMTRQNAENASRCKALMQEAKQIVGTVHDHMAAMGNAIEKITRSSEDTGKIIKTIDEIAFQTNLLALNAAVEAARAGEAGAGFAVVADEVRNLALRAAEAAKNTNELIEATISSVKDGGELTRRTQDAFNRNLTITASIGEVIEEIAAASHEQTQGIEQVSKAVVSMDRVTQNNAANAEESASASEEMNGQAEQMKGFVESLAVLVGSTGNGHGER